MRRTDRRKLLALPPNSLGIVAVDYSKNYPDKESERRHTKHDEDIP